MRCKNNQVFRPGIIIICILIWGVLIIYNNESKAAKQLNSSTDNFPLPKSITNIKILEHPQSIDILVQSNRTLTYTSVKQPTPLGVILYFSKTSLDTSENVFTPPNNIIHSVNASELTKKGHTSKIKILLKKDVFYEIIRENNGLKISFSKIAQAPIATSTQESAKTFESKSFTTPELVQPISANINENFQKATRLQSVYAAKIGDILKIFVGADGMITNYKSFTIDNPASIVFDLFNITSPYQNEKIIPVNTKWVNQIRYSSYPDKVRIILETAGQYLNDFSGVPTENGLLIQMGQRETSQTAVSRPLPSNVQTQKSEFARSSSDATRLQSVYATQLDKSMLVTVRGNGTMNNYKTSIQNNPPQIIVDIFGVESNYNGEQSFPVDTQWVKNVRHQRYPDKIQVILETSQPYLSNFSAKPDPNGLVIHIGSGTGVVFADTVGIPESINVPSEPNVTPEVSQSALDYTQPALIDKIDFINENAGKSTLILNTTRSVQYEVKETNSKSLEIKLFNTKLTDQNNRPLITNYFESAVDKITPIKKSSNPNTAFFNIQLRDSVPYFVEQQGNSLKLHFEASSISPSAPLAGITPNVTQPAPIIPAAPQPQVSTTPVPAVSAPVIPPAQAVLGNVNKPSPETSLSSTAASDLDLGSIDDLVDDTPKYTGEKIALDFYETDIKNVFRILREISGKNFAIDKDVTGKVTLTLGQPVPWDQVLDLVLKMNKLGKTVEENIIRIATRQTLDEEEKIRQEKRTAELTLLDQQKQLEPLITEYLPVNYSNASREIKPHIEKMLTKNRGSASVDDRTNMVIMTDTAEKINRAKELIRKLDRVTPQVIIEARVVEANTSFSKAFGTQWDMGVGVSDEVAELNDTVGDTVSDKVGVGPERGYDALGGTYGYNMSMNVPAGNVGSIGFSFARIAGTPLLLNAKLMAMESQGEGKIISAPKVVTLDNKEAIIKQGVDYPYRGVDKNGNSIIKFKSIDLELSVTPHVTPDNRISMTISISKNDIGSVISGEQAFTTKNAETELLINDGDTVVIGGIIKTFENQGSDGIPGLSKIPLIGWLFKNYSYSTSKEELLIFITPRIVQLEQRTAQF